MKKKINFGGEESSGVLPRPPVSKDAPTIGNPLMMKMEYASRREKKGKSGSRS